MPFIRIRWITKRKNTKSKIYSNGCGIVGFILILVYVIYSGIVYTNYYDSEIYEFDGDRAFSEYNKDENTYEYFYYKKNETYSI